MAIKNQLALVEKYSTPPEGYSFATKYEKNKTSVGIFPTQFKDLDIKKVPKKYNPSKANSFFYFAKLNDEKEWNVILYGMSGWDGEKSAEKKRAKGSPEAIKKALLCYAHEDFAHWNFIKNNDDAAIDKSIEILKECFSVTGVYENLKFI